MRATTLRCGRSSDGLQQRPLALRAGAAVAHRPSHRRTPCGSPDRLREAGRAGDAEVALADGPARRSSRSAAAREPWRGFASSAANAGAAHALYLDVLRAQPGDTDALRGAAGTSLRPRRPGREARGLVQAGLLAPAGRPRMQQLAAYVAERQGDDGGAMRELRRAAALEEGTQLERPAAATEGGVGRAAAAEGAPRLASQAQSDELRAQIARDMQRIEDRHRPAIGGQFGLPAAAGRDRPGSAHRAARERGHRRADGLRLARAAPHLRGGAGRRRGGSGCGGALRQRRPPGQRLAARHRHRAARNLRQPPLRRRIWEPRRWAFPSSPWSAAPSFAERPDR